MSKIIDNRYGVKVKVCCASCAHKKYDNGGLRICMRGQGHVDKEDICSQWTMNDAIDYVRTDGEKGRIHKKEWINFLVEHASLDEEQMKLMPYAQKRQKPKLDVHALKRKYEKEVGSVYLFQPFDVEQ